MTIENDFLPFAVGASANVEDQSDYAALAALATGFQSGIASSAQMNKVWRQSSIMAAVVAQFIVDYSGQPAIDDGTTATLEANLLTALKTLQAGTIGEMTKGSAKLTAAGKTFTFTADQIIVGAALGGQQYHLSGVSASINTATTGLGGMNTGTPTVSGFVGVYLLYNPTTASYGLLAVNEASAILPMICAAASIPSGYTASCLIGVYWTDASGNFTLFQQVNRRVYNAGATAYSATGAATLTGFQYPNVPVSALKVSGAIGITNTAAAVDNATIYPWSTGGPGPRGGTRNMAGAGATTISFSDLLLDRLTAPRASFITVATNAGTCLVGVTAYDYEI